MRDDNMIQSCLLNVGFKHILDKNISTAPKQSGMILSRKAGWDSGTKHHNTNPPSINH